MVRSVGVRKNVEGLVKGLRKFLKESSVSESEDDVESSPDMFAASDVERDLAVASVEETAEAMSEVSDEEPAEKKVKKKDSKPKGATKAKVAAKVPVAKSGKSPQAGGSGTSKFAEKKKLSTKEQKYQRRKKILRTALSLMMMKRKIWTLHTMVLYLDVRDHQIFLPKRELQVLLRKLKLEQTSLVIR